MTRKLALSLLLAAGVAGCGAGEPASGAVEEIAETAATPAEVHEVTVTMDEFSFVSTDTVFQAGVTYRITFVNTGQLEHEWAVVPRGATDESNLLFEVEEDELQPGARLVRDFTFPSPGDYDFACFLPGHYEGGMVLPVRVE